MEIGITDGAIELILKNHKAHFDLYKQNQDRPLTFFMKFAEEGMHRLTHSIKVSNQGAVYFLNVLYHCALKQRWQVQNIIKGL